MVQTLLSHNFNTLSSKKLNGFFCRWVLKCRKPIGALRLTNYICTMTLTCNAILGRICEGKPILGHAFYG
jgi:hypothetical protein